MKVEMMNHTGFVVSNMVRSLAFYRDLLGEEQLGPVLLLRRFQIAPGVPGFQHVGIGVYSLKLGVRCHA